MSASIEKNQPIKIAINALGGQGGGVLATWLVELGKSQYYQVQSTSVPGVAPVSYTHLTLPTICSV